MAATIEARLFGGGAPPTGEAVTLQLSGSLLEVRSARGSLRVPVSSLRLREVVSVHDVLELSWQQRGEQCALHVLSAEGQRALRAHPPLQDAGLLAPLRAGARRRRIGWWIGGTLLGLFLLLPLLVLLLFLWQADRIADVIATRIGVTQEQQLGQAVFATMRGRLKLQTEGPALQLVRDIGTTLTTGSQFRYEFHVADDPAINAFALPGGIIVLHSGLIDVAQRPEQVAAVLAHEVQHVEQRHSLTALIKDLGLRGAWAAISGDMGGTLAGQAAVKLASLRFSRDAEREADERGFDALVAHEIDPRGMVEFFGTLAQQGGTSAPAWLSTHPASAQRQERIRARVGELGDRTFPPLQAGTGSASQ